VAALVLVVAAAILAPGAALADDRSDPEPGAETEASSTEATSAYSLWDLEAAAYYMSDYGGSGNLPNSYANVSGWYNTLRNSIYSIWFGYPRYCNVSGHDCFIYGNSSAWEDDWVDNNNYYIDTVDVVFYEGHGWPGGFTLRAPDDEYVQHGEVQGYWGNVDLEWVFLLSCSVIADSSRGDWYGAMAGLHGIAGFRNTAYDVNGFGPTLANYMVLGYDYSDAWFMACDSKQPSGVDAQIIVEDPAYWDESAYYQYGDAAHDGWYWWWWKSCGAEAPAHVTPEALNQTFPVYSTPPLSAAEVVTVTNKLSGAFEFDGGGRSIAATNFVSDTVDGTRIISDTEGRLLQIDKNTGLFYYYDPSRTFTPTVALARSGDAILTQEEAKVIADQFLADNGIMPGDAVFNSVANVELGAGTMNELGRGVAISETVSAYQVIYNRYLPATIVDAAGVATSHQIPVDGPGAKIKVYVDPNSTGAVQVATANQLGAVTGAMGGWRNVVPGGRAVSQIELLDYDTQILAIFNSKDLEPLASYESVPFPDAISKTVVTYTVSGWEEANGESQAEIYPAFRLNAEYMRVVTGTTGLTQTVVLTGSTWIAGNPDYMRPLARLEAVPAAGSVFSVGDAVTATAVDASRTLADLGYGAALNFAMADIQDAGDASYVWFLGDEVTGKQIGTGRTLNYTLTPEDLADPKGTLTTLVITLKVTDIGPSARNESLNSSTSNFSIDAVPYVYLPGVEK
jgi:hypothetical protein